LSKRIYLDDYIPIYIPKIPKNNNDEVCFYFPKIRIDNMEDLIKGLGHEFSVPL